MAKKKNKPVEKVLSDYEMLKLDKLNLESRVANYEVTIAKLQKELAIKQYNDKILELGKVSEKVNNERSKFNKELKEKFEILGDSWGYDPLTGEINE